VTRNVAVTGIGWVTPLGCGAEPVWKALLAGRNGIGPITRFDAAPYATRFAGEARDFRPVDWMDVRTARHLDRFVQFAVAAGAMALKDSGLEADKLDPYRAGVLVGSGSGGIETIEEGQTRLINRGPDRVPPLSIPKMMINAASAALAEAHGLKGPSFAVTAACSTGAVAVAQAASCILTGQAEVMLAGGSEASITPLSMAAFSACGALSKRNDDPVHASRPFDLRRDGFVMSEGGAVLVLEEMARARARGARIYAELSGWGLTSDSHHITAPEPTGEPAARAISGALAMSGEPVDAVGYINAHGTGTPLNDPAETRAIRLALGAAADRVPVSSTKSMLGHMLGAAGAAEAAIAALAVHTGRIPPTMNIEEQDPACDLDCVPGSAREAKGLRLALSNSFAFGGHNACLAMRRA